MSLLGPYGAASYIIHKDADACYATPQMEGLPHYVNAADNTTIQNAIDASPAGALIYFQPGAYTSIDLDVDAAQGLRLLGSGRGNDTGTYGGTVLYLLSGGRIDFSNTADERWFSYIGHMTISGGDNASTTGICTDNQMVNKKASFLMVEAIHFVGFKGASSYPIDIMNHERVTIRDCSFLSVGNGGTEIRLRSDGTYNPGNSWIQNNYWTVDSGITNSIFFELISSGNNDHNNYEISGNASFCRDYPNYFIHLNSTNGPIKILHIYSNRMEYNCFIKCTGTGNIEDVDIYDNALDAGTNLDYNIEMPVNARNWRIHSNRFANLAGRTAIYDPSDETSYPNLIHDNVFYGGGTYYTPSGTPPTKIYNNIGYVTENSSTDTVTSGTTHTHVTHGLSYTPTAADITINFTEAPTNAVKPWLSGFSSTEFILNTGDPGASNLDFTWSARKTFA